MNVRFPWARARLVRHALLVSAPALLTACGGGGGGGGTSPAPQLTITSQPSDVHILDGQGATLSVSATGASSYEWQELGPGGWGDVQTSASATLALAAVPVADSGEQFRVIVHGAAGSVTSSVVTLTVDAVVVAPSLQYISPDQTVYSGQAVSLSVTAQGTSPTYQWQRSTDNGAHWSDIAGAGDTTLTFTADIGDPQDQYRAVVSNSAGTLTSVPSKVTVNAAPAQPLFLFNPVDTPVSVGGAISFSAQAVGDPAPTIVWQSAYGAGGVWTDIPGATGGTYTLAAVTAADDGRVFRAVATNANGSTTSGMGTLSVTSTPGPAAISEQPVDVLAGVGTYPTFRAFGYGGQGVTYQWQVSTDAGATFTNINNATGTQFQPGSVAMSDSGKLYRVVVSNGLGSATSHAAALTVMRQPTLTTYGLGQPYWRPGVTDASFMVVASGEQLHYQWRIGTNPYGYSTNLRDVDGATGTTFVMPASTDAAINTVCVVITNPVGSTQSCGYPQALTWHVVNPQPFSDSVTAIARVDGHTAVASDVDGAFLRSTDAGLTWTRVTDGVSLGNFQNSIAFSGQNGIAVGYDYTLKLSSDGGQHWVETPYESLHWNGVAFASSGRAIRVGVGGHIALSADQGHTWTDATTDTNTNDLKAVDFGASGIGLAVGDGGTIRRSADNGATWTTVHLGGAGMTSVAFAPGGTAIATDWNGVFWRSTDGGLTWNSIASGGAIYLQRVRFTPSGVGLAVNASGAALLRSVDDGLTWTPMSIDGGLLDIASLDGGVVLAGGGGATMLRSADDGQTWTSLVTGDRHTLLAVARVDSSTAVAVGLGGTIRRTADAGATWSNVPSHVAIGLYGVAFAGGSSSQNGLAVGENGTILRSADGGNSWSTVATLPAMGGLRSVAYASANVAVIGADNGLLRTTDGGASWTAVAGFGLFSDLAGVSFGDANVGVAIGAGGQLWRTADGGATWTSVAAQPGLLVTDFASPTTAVALDGDGTFLRSTDGGVTWTPLGTQWYPISSFSAVAFRDASTGFAVGSYVYETTDGGLTWTTLQGSQRESLRGVVLLGTHTVVAVGESGLIYESDAY